ncbi:MAG: UDP-N-acetylglucosamine 2-epimerase (non-hydrolyzing) [Gammaproteobacteria bacterium]|nr:UDP-N-acetylglucosamine 2-epimerase (non-hydrolyzing) [Gammaproteobacteria bacterium]MDE0178711.1 UDP-N-acetylglucosamine 2-epimerase (non-hydrolyzing) [Gammaproteobacteria bacterium]
MRILSVIGTRPEAIKMAMVARALDGANGIEHRICATAQHREMLDSVLGLFDLRPHYDLDVMVPEQDLTHVTQAVLTGMTPILEGFKPDRVLVQGDTTTTFAAALGAYYADVPVGHVEAGLRSGDPTMPWPEEMNRRLADRLSDRHYAPTRRARENLLAEGFHGGSIVVTGNTGIDALLHVVERLEIEPHLAERARSGLPHFDTTRRVVLVTAHRRENLGTGLAEICDALARLVNRDDVEIVYPVHPNPHVHGPVYSALGGLPHVHLLPPLNYVSFAYLMSQAHFIVTDSGGIQEEAPSLGKPVLVLREVTERPEAVEAQTARLVGTDADVIHREAARLLDDTEAHDTMARRHNLYGDGRASGRIVGDLAR